MFGASRFAFGIFGHQFSMERQDYPGGTVSNGIRREVGAAIIRKKQAQFGVIYRYLA
jgi:hypothetical protein